MDKINTQIKDDFEQFFLKKTRVFSLQKVQKIQFTVQRLYNIYLTKAKSRTLSLFIKNTQHVQNRSIICRPAIYDLQTRTVTFPGQEKLLEKVDAG